MINFTSDEMFPEVQRRLKEKIPTAVIRMGDGEAMTLNGFNDQDALRRILRKLLGTLPSVEEIEQIQKNLIYAYQNADIIGIPVNKRLDQPDSYWYKALKILVEHAGPTVVTNTLLTSIDFHLIWQDRGYFEQLLTGIDTLNYVSCRPLDDAFKRRFGIKHVCSFQIAPEMSFTPEYSGDPHYPVQFDQVRRWMKAAPIDGNLCLVGAGVVGKIYNCWFKDYGGISLDVGSCFDAWAGRLTRGPGRGAGKFDDTFKL